jgi:hypothetical protein
MNEVTMLEWAFISLVSGAVIARVVELASTFRTNLESKYGV